MPSSWLVAWVVVAAVARAQSFATRDELELIEALARDGFADLAHARLAALTPRLAAGELPFAQAAAARVARRAAELAATPSGRRALLEDGVAALRAALASAPAAPKQRDALRCELVATLRELARARAPDDVAAAVAALHEARRELELLLTERTAGPAPPGDAALVDAWLPLLDSARLCFDEALLLAPDDPQHAGRLRSAREQADQFAWKVGARSIRSVDARLLAGRAALALGDFEESAARMRALCDDDEAGAAFALAPDTKGAAAQTWFDALAGAAASGGEREAAALRDALPRLETLGAKGAVFLLAADEFAAAFAAPAADPAAAAAIANERIVRLESALLWLRLVAPDDPDRDRALLLAARCTLALAVAGHATLNEALAPLDALANLAAARPPADPARAAVRERLLLEAQFDRSQIECELGRADAALAGWRALASTLLERLERTQTAADRALLRDVARALGGELVERDGGDVATAGAGARVEAAALWERLATMTTPATADSADPSARAAWREAAFYSIWCLPDDAAAVARQRLAEFAAAFADADPAWSRRIAELRARWR